MGPEVVDGFGTLLGPEKTPAVGVVVLGMAAPGLDRLTHRLPCGVCGCGGGCGGLGCGGVLSVA
jgi:hypothetical protein